MAVLLVRHGRAGDQRRWRGDDDLRPLDERGRRQAAAIADQISAYAPFRIMTSPTLRCVETVVPLGAALGVAVEESDDLRQGRYEEALAVVRSLASGPTAAICTHGDVLVTVLETLVDEGLAGDIGKPRCKKGAFWVVDTEGGRFAAARYFRPLI